MGIKEKLPRWLSGQDPPPQRSGLPEHTALWAARQPDPYATWQAYWESLGPRLYAGMGAVGVTGLAPRTNVLVMGPSQSGIGKTSSVATPVMCTATGPVVATTTKRVDQIQPTLTTRMRRGTCWVFSSHPEKIPPGTKAVKWSPVDASGTWDDAVRIAQEMVEMSDPSGTAQALQENGTTAHFKVLAKSALTVLLRFANIQGRPMSWVTHQMSAADFKEVRAFAEKHPQEHVRLLSKLKGFSQAGENERGSISTTGQTILDAYNTDLVEELTNETTFDVKDFVAGNPFEVKPDLHCREALENRAKEIVAEGGQVMGGPQLFPRGEYDTLYISASTFEQRQLAPIITLLLAEIRRARYALTEEDYDNRVKRPPLTMVLDELAHIAPDPYLPNQLAEGGSQGVLTVGVLQDLSQAKTIWGKDTGQGFLTLWQNILILPGIRDTDTLSALTKMIGQRDRRIVTENESWTTGAQSSHSNSYGEQYSREDIIPMEYLANGHPHYAGQVPLFQHGGGVSYVYLPPYYNQAPWLQMLVENMVKAPSGLGPLPYPELDRGALARVGLLNRYDWASNRLREEPPLNAPTPTPKVFEYIVICAKPGEVADMTQFTSFAMNWVEVEVLDWETEFTVQRIEVARSLLEREIGFAVKVRSDEKEMLDRFCQEANIWFPTLVIHDGYVRRVEDDGSIGGA